MLEPTMLYCAGDTETWEGVSYNYVIVDACEVEAKLDEGYVRHPFDLKKPKSRKKQTLVDAGDDVLGSELTDQAGS